MCVGGEIKLAPGKASSLLGIISASGEMGSLIVTEYRDLVDVFDKKPQMSYPPHQPYICPIGLQSEQRYPLYVFIMIRTLEPSNYLGENLAKNFLQHSKLESPSTLLEPPSC